MVLIKTFFTIALFTSTLLLASCSGDDKSDKSKAEVTAPAATSTPLQPSTATQTTPTDTTALQKNGEGIALNPQHGQPGHRCDIAVGAPLNSAPNTANTQVVIPPTTTTTAIVPATTANTATVKMNPKHGEPGHRCDIAVGAPLDGSKQ